MTNYRLLRNNKESGPFTAGQLIKLGFKAYDLIWVEGKSAGWRYPGELEEFRPYAPIVEEQPYDRFYKKEGVEKTNAINGVFNLPPGTTTMAVKQKPRIRIKAEWSRIDPVTAQVAYTQPATVIVPEQSKQVATVQQAIPTLAKPVAAVQQALPKDTQSALATGPAKTGKPSWESSWLDWQQEKNAVKQAAKTSDANEAAAIVSNKAAGVEPVLETKFSQSLNDIKERYAATVLKTKAKAGEWRKFKSIAILAMLAVPVLGFGIWFGHNIASDNSLQKVVAKTVVPNARVANVQQTEPADNAVNNVQAAENEKKPQEQKKDNAKELIPSFDDDNTAKPEAKQNEASKKQLGQTRFVPVNPAVKQQPATTKKDTRAAVRKNAGQAQSQQGARQRYVFTQPGNAGPGARNKTINQSLLSNQNNNNAYSKQPNSNQQAITKPQENGNPIFSRISKKEKIGDYVSVDTDQPSARNVQDLKLNINNIADFPLDLVVIDVEYFDANNRFKTGQTISVKNIPSGETVNVKVPDNAAATRIRYRVSLVSAEQKGVYLIGE